MNLRTAIVAALLAIPASVLAVTPAPGPAAPPGPAGQTTPVKPLVLVPTSDQIQASKLASEFLERFHYHPVAFDAAFSASVLDLLVKTLDPSRSYFTTGDLAQWAPLRSTLATDLRQGNVAPAMAPVNRYLQRAAEDIRYEQTLLADGFDFSAKESVDIDRKAAPWPTSDDELHDLWRKNAKDDWLRLKLAGETDKAIRTTLSRRYASTLRRLQETTPSDAFEILMTACANSTDPHTDYFVPQTASEFASEMSLSLEGIGAYLREHEDAIEVTELVPGSPATKSGQIHVGDRIVGVGQGKAGAFTDVIGWRSEDVVTLIRGKAGSTVRLELAPAGTVGDTNLKHVSIVRRKVSMEDQAASSTVVHSVDKGVSRTVGIITVPSFYEDFDAYRAGDPKYRSLTRDVAGMLVDFKAKHVDSVLLDLRDDGGGSLDEAAGLSGLFMGEGPVVQVRNAHGDVEVQDAPEEPAVWTGPMGVLVNHGSASASEIFAAAIQDRGRGLIIGERTFGKGTVQNLQDLSKYSADPKQGLGELKMTIAEFFRINGTSTQLAGVTPDVAFPTRGNEALFGESSYDNALPNSRIAAVPFDRSDALATRIADFRKNHEDRIAHSERWALMLDELKSFQKSIAIKSESLNFAERKASRDADIAAANSLRDRRRAIDKKEGVTNDTDDADAVKGDDGLVATERKLPAHSPSDKVNPATDAQVQEAAQIVGDEAPASPSMPVAQG